ncbi:hypothetical protein EVAR_62623_1 [Eumeta japonica]|uniref:Uncharacterized protein n=1 Tax=Eumeta variegata TaxID=151549 RepID=A0A4C1ZJ54_EUMVA|nr:hypothetical protein EVAR_62623_1 [Eumeta japonica]
MVKETLLLLRHFVVRSAYPWTIWPKDRSYLILVLELRSRQSRLFLDFDHGFDLDSDLDPALDSDPSLALNFKLGLYSRSRCGLFLDFDLGFDLDSDLDPALDSDPSFALDFELDLILDPDVFTLRVPIAVLI